MHEQLKRTVGIQGTTLTLRKVIYEQTKVMSYIITLILQLERATMSVLTWVVVVQTHLHWEQGSFSL